MNAVFYHNEAQRRAALDSKAALSEKRGESIRTEIRPLKSFYRAEDYHQKYYLRGHKELARELLEIYPDTRSFVDSTAAARLNGYIGGYGDRIGLNREIDRLGLSSAGRAIVERLVR